MADWLLIRLPRAPATDASWIVADARGVAVESPAGGPLALATPAAAVVASDNGPLTGASTATPRVSATIHAASS